MKGDKVNSPKVGHAIDQDENESNRGRSVGHFGEFSQSTSVHGLRHISVGKHSRFRRGFWGVAFLCMLGGLLYTLFFQVVAMMSYPSRMEQTMKIKDRLPFPAVTICNLNQFRRSIFGQDKKMRLLLLSLTDFGLVRPSINWSDPIWDYETENENFDEEALAFFGHSVEKTLQICSWDNKPFDCRKRFKTIRTDFGMCFTFNGRENLTTKPLMSYHSGSKYGLTVIADVMQYEYMLGYGSDVAGLRVLLHDPSETPLVEGRGFDVGPGSATKASLLYKQVNYLPPPYTLPFGDHKQCVNLSSENFENFLKLYDRYNRMACVSECRQNYMVKACGCRGLFDLVNASLCHSKETLECYVPNLDDFMAKNLEWDCKCPLPCTWNIYEARVSAGNYPSTVLMEEVGQMYNFTITEEDYRKNFLKLTVAYDYFMMESINQVPEFSFESIMSTLGGQMGIFLGASLLTVLEFLEFGLELLYDKFLRSRNKTMSGS